MTRSNTQLSLRRVTRTYGNETAEVVALNNIDLEVKSGELLVIMGPSGSGKSTLLTIAGGLEAPTSGSVEFDGRDLWALKPAQLAKVRRSEIGFVFQELNLLTGLTAAENVAAPLELDGVSSRAARSEAVAALESVGLADRAEAFPDDLSGGERQRVSIARGLIGGRQLLLADEPTGALDSVTGNEVLDLFEQASAKNTAVVIVTHDPIVAERADRIVSLKDGQVISDETASNGALR